jgi:hypothetical protein
MLTVKLTRNFKKLLKKVLKRVKYKYKKVLLSSGTIVIFDWDILNRNMEKYVVKVFG